MSPEFRSRVFTPLILPATVIGLILAYAFALSRVLLAVPDSIATITGVSVAGYVLLVAALISTRPQITSRALAVGLVLGFAGVLVAGAVAGIAGIRPVEKTGAEAASAASATGGTTAIPAGALVFKTGAELKFVQAPTTAKAGVVTIALENSSGQLHNVVFAGVNGDKPIVEVSKATKVGKITLQPGTVTYYCGIPGHRQAGMEGTITVQ
jgi:plastocyanin